MPTKIYKDLGLNTLMPMSMKVELANRSVATPKGVVENVFVKCPHFVYTVDLVIMDMEGCSYHPRETILSNCDHH
ncbi:unnamed protein product [Linum trigynum]|uniref:Uncharacterized protein n=1 Tax=Linum trigynum TaxID=586398 RepID=A0AAV2EWA1_9ROSI